MPRIARICAMGYPYHITQRGNNKQTVFFKDEDRKFYLETLRRYSYKWALEILAYCLMTNHVHILAIPKQEKSLARGMGNTNLLYTQYINCNYKRSGRLWQNRFFSTIIEEEVYLWAAARYIERNSVRAKLVEKAEDYPWSSARAHVLGMKDNIVSGKHWLGENKLNDYRNFLRNEDKDFETSIRKASSTGRPLGTEGFIRKLENTLGRNILLKKVGRPKKQE